MKKLYIVFKVEQEPIHAWKNVKDNYTLPRSDVKWQLAIFSAGEYTL
jgi:hypothetical protein